ncbi:MAG: von Willebrand factor type A domain-containing protein [Candidatus Cloacimonetes bacterium]|nr:von Willebrand factor type A domain-containing protein [Candidatus Cloacimonadota bacterium]
MKITIIFCLILLMCGTLFAGTTGKLAGKVVDEQGNPITNFRVELKNTSLSAKTQKDGTYEISDIPPGFYDVVCTTVAYFSAYAPKTIKSVKIVIDETNTLNFVLGKFGDLTGKVVDEQGNPIAYARVQLKDTSIGAMTKENGTYMIINIPPGTYNVICSMVSFSPVTIEDVKIGNDETKTLNFVLQKQSIELSGVTVKADKYPDGLVALQPSATKDTGLQFRGGRANEVFFSAPQTGGLRNDFNTEEYSPITENSYFETIKDPMSTFGADVDAASYSNFRRFIMMDNLPHADVIRTEELVNYFNYDYKEPTGENPLSINIEYGETPWNEKSRLVHIGLKGKVLKKEEQTQNNLVFLLDVSGSMSSENKLPLLKRSFKLMVDHLADDDFVSIVVYAGSAGIVLQPTKAKDKDTIIGALDKLNAGGSTAGGQGIMLAYKTASENFIRNGNNRVILATDGDFNVGISSTSELVKYVKRRRMKGFS